jgi:hypothetical protein
MRDIFCRSQQKRPTKALKETYNRGVLPRFRKTKRREGGKGRGSAIDRAHERASERANALEIFTFILYICIIMFVFYTCSIMFAYVYIIVRVYLCVMSVYVSVCGLCVLACRQGLDDEEISTFEINHQSKLK